MAKTTVLANLRKDNGTPMTKAEVILELTKTSLISGYRYADRAKEIYESLVKDGTFVEEERDV